MDENLREWITTVLYHCGYLRTDDGLCVGDIREAMMDVLFWTMVKAAVEGRLEESLRDPKMSEGKVLHIMQLGPQWEKALGQILGLQVDTKIADPSHCIIVISHDKRQS